MIVQVIGYLAAALTTLCQIPQALRIMKTHHTKDISLTTYTVLGLGIFLWVIYGIYVNDVVIILANVATFIVVFYIWVLKIKFG